MEQKLNISLSPHIHSGRSVSRTMWLVIVSLIPALLVALWTFGIPAVRVTLVCVAGCVLTEWFVTRFMLRRETTLSDGSAILTGLLLAFNLPSILPWWMALIGSVVAIGIAKMSFGGLGRNIWNPALVGRVFLLLSFPAAMTTWPTGVVSGLQGADAATGATVLTAMKMDPAAGSAPDFMGMMIGHMNGSLGEVGSLALLLGLVFLLCMGIVSWHIPVSVLGSAALLSWALGGDPLLDIFAGGLILGACYMATDYVTSPMTHGGQLLYGALIGCITVIIRRYGAYPEGVSFAILLMNSFTPLINRYFRPRVFGERESRLQMKKS